MMLQILFRHIEGYSFLLSTIKARNKKHKKQIYKTWRRKEEIGLRNNAQRRLEIENNDGREKKSQESRRSKARRRRNFHFKNLSLFAIHTDDERIFSYYSAFERIFWDYKSEVSSEWFTFFCEFDEETILCTHSFGLCAVTSLWDVSWISSLEVLHAMHQNFHHFQFQFFNRNWVGAVRRLSHWEDCESWEVVAQLISLRHKRAWRNLQTTRTRLKKSLQHERCDVPPPREEASQEISHQKVFF